MVSEVQLAKRLAILSVSCMAFGLTGSKPSGADRSLPKVAGETPRNINFTFAQVGLEPPRPHIETNSVRAMINILRNGPFLGFLSQTHCNAYHDMEPVALADELPIREGGVTWRKDRPLLPSAQALIEETERVVAEILARE